MKSKIFLFFIILSISGCFINGTQCAPQGESDHSEISAISSDDNILDGINKILTRTRGNLENNFEKTIYNVIVKSLDKQCMVDQYKLFNLIDAVPNEENIRGIKSGKTIAVFFDIVTLCSSKTDVLLEYAFKNLMTHQILLKAFIDDPALKEFSTMLKCANKYAVDRKILDPSTLNLEYTFDTEKEEADCAEMIEQYQMILLLYVDDFRRAFGSTCTIISEAEKLVVKYVLKIQIDMSSEQKSSEKKSLVEEAHIILKDFLRCAAQESSWDYNNNKI